MAAQTPRKRFALDTNIIFDLAGDKDFAHTFIEVFKEKGYGFFLPPTAVQELAFAYKHQPEKRDLAYRGLTGLRQWGIKEFDLVAVEHGITETFSLFLQARNLLPSGEHNDGFILAETALAEIEVLVTSDHHLLNIAPDQLKGALQEKDLANVSVFHPKRLLMAVNINPK